MPLNFKSIKNMKPTRSRWFFVGEMGSGKTTVASTFPDPFYIVYNGENSLATLKSRGVDADYVEVGGEGVMAQCDSILNELYAMQKKDPNTLPGQTLVWESLTHFSAAIVEELSKNAKGGAMSQREWGFLTTFFSRAQQILWQLDMNIVFTAYPHYKLNDQGQIISAGPRIQGSSSETLPGACEHHGYCDVLSGEGKRADIHRVFFRKVNNYPARTRSATLPREIHNFKYSDIASHLT